MQFFFHWTGLTYSQMCFLRFTCVSVSSLGSCVNVRVCVRLYAVSFSSSDSLFLKTKVSLSALPLRCAI